MIISTVYAINLNHHSEFIHAEFTAVYGHNQYWIQTLCLEQIKTYNVVIFQKQDPAFQGNILKMQS